MESPRPTDSNVLNWYRYFIDMPAEEFDTFVQQLGPLPTGARVAYHFIAGLIKTGSDVQGIRELLDRTYGKAGASVHDPAPPVIAVYAKDSGDLIKEIQRLQGAQ